MEQNIKHIKMTYNKGGESPICKLGVRHFNLLQSYLLCCFIYSNLTVYLFYTQIKFSNLRSQILILYYSFFLLTPLEIFSLLYIAINHGNRIRNEP